ncbi:MAG TPA: phosphoenolpyruvate--protein phosphotransferase [Gammaproteobacteria bacterium]|nr:phosphoenolpyruvate--protein phosphotransferase [Gammaproteobacteria bacterium]
MALVLTGSGVSNGIAIGEAHVLQRDQLEISEYALPSHLIEEEVARFRAALAAAKQRLEEVRHHIPSYAPPEIASFIETHLLMLEDSTLAQAPEEIIRRRGCNAEWALKLQRDTLVTVFEDMNDPYLRTRRDDVDHVVTSIQRLLLTAPSRHDMAPERPMQGQILVADDLTPADTVLMQHQGFAAFVTESGGPTSHTAILARSLRIPAIVSIHHARRYLRDGDLIIIDGQRGVVLASPDDYSLDYYRARQREEKRRHAQLNKLRNLPAITRDGVSIKLQGNVELPDDIDALRQAGAEGVGLFRTEYLFMNRAQPPDEQEQFEVYARIVRRLRGQPLTIRTLDLGADKQVDGGRQDTPVTTNPALGLRAIRLCLREPGVFLPQLRAILRASAHGPVRMMIPMLSNAQELAQVVMLVDQTRRELSAVGQRFDPDMPIGGMIEVPAAALGADILARNLDFLSIGTNDLIQYTLAIDRVDDEVSYLYDPLNPGVLALIHMTIAAGERAGIPVAMCGEMAGDPRFTRLLLGLGLTEFSMHPSMLPEVKYIISRSHLGRLRERVARFMAEINDTAIADFVEQVNQLD